MLKNSKVSTMTKGDFMKNLYGRRWDDDWNIFLNAGHQLAWEKMDKEGKFSQMEAIWKDLEKNAMGEVYKNFIRFHFRMTKSVFDYDEKTLKLIEHYYDNNDLEEAKRDLEKYMKEYMKFRQLLDLDDDKLTELFGKENKLDLLKWNLQHKMKEARGCVEAIEHRTKYAD